MALHRPYTKNVDQETKSRNVKKRRKNDDFLTVDKCRPKSTEVDMRQFLKIHQAFLKIRSAFLKIRQAFLKILPAFLKILSAVTITNIC